jgi:ubiquinone/menaquinone biosynthesis C-methylase UbiE
MPVDAGVSKDGVVFQREQYAKGGLSRRYWDFRDEQIIEAVADILRAGGRVADVGCGEGILLEKIVKRFPMGNIEGLDMDPINIKICREHGLHVREGGAYELPYEDASLDACLFIEVIEHLKEPGRALDELYRVLKPGGRLAILFPNDVTFKAARIMMLMFKEAFYDTGHVRQWTPGAMAKELKSRRFRIIARKSLPLPLFFMSLHHLAVAEKNG